MIKIEGRSLKIPTQERIIGWVGDNRVEVRTFELSRHYSDIDLAGFDFKLDTQSGDVKNIIDLDKTVSEDKIILIWNIAESHLLHSGYMSIQLRAFSGNEEKWHSAQDYVRVQPSINAAAAIPSPLPSEFEQMEQQITAMRNEVVEKAAIVEEASTEVLPQLMQAIEDAGDTKNLLDGSIEAAGTAKTQLDGSISSAGTAKTELEGTITQANIVKGQLDGSITQAGTKKTELDGSITAAGQIKEQLDESIATGDIAAFRAEFESHKNDFTTQLNYIQSFAPIFGASWDKGSSPILTRTHDSVNLVANVGVDSQIVRNDFDAVSIFGDIEEVEDDYGNIFVRIPKFYIRKTDGGNIKTWQVSKGKRTGWYLPWCFWDFENKRELLYVDVGKYKASLSPDNKLESKPDAYPLISKTIVNFRNYARNNNVSGLKGYQLLDIHVVDLLQTLMYVEFATLDLQSVMAGYTSGQYADTHLATVAEDNTNRIIVANAHANLYRVGQTISVGTTRGGNQVFYGRTITAIEEYDADNKAIYFDGDPVNIAVGNRLYNSGWKNGFSKDIAASSGSLVSNTDGKYPCVYRGIESPYGDTWQFVDGVNINNYQAWVAKDASDYMSNVFAAPYEKLSYVNSTANGYAKEMGWDPEHPFAAFPVDVSGGSTTYYSDYYYQNAGQRIALVGGYWLTGSSAGPSFWNLYDSSGNANVYVGGRLLKKPL